jgi:DNA-binding GntR family transcriptional regulator
VSDPAAAGSDIPVPVRKSPETKADLVAQALREDIAAGVIPRGDRLDQRDLAARFGISPTPVREALMALAAEGILVHERNQGVTVADITSHSLEEFEEIFQMRQALERLATERAHDHFSRAQLAELAKVQDAFREAVSAGELQRAQILNYTFHMRIYERAEAPRMFRTIETLWTLFPWDTLWLMRVGEANPSSVGSHDDIVEALTTGTAEDAARLMFEHIDSGHDALRDEVTRRAADRERHPGTGLTP